MVKINKTKSFTLSRDELNPLHVVVCSEHRTSELETSQRLMLQFFIIATQALQTAWPRHTPIASLTTMFGTCV